MPVKVEKILREGRDVVHSKMVGNDRNNRKINILTFALILDL